MSEYFRVKYTCVLGTFGMERNGRKGRISATPPSATSLSGTDRVPPPNPPCLPSLSLMEEQQW
jgi:hypothetical protein